MMDGGGWMFGQSWLGWLVMWVVMLAFWAALITAVVLGIRYLGASDRHVPRDTRRRPEDMLAERYARGEIDDDEYRRRVALLREHNSVP